MAQRDGEEPSVPVRILCRDERVTEAPRERAPRLRPRQQPPGLGPFLDPVDPVDPVQLGLPARGEPPPRSARGEDPPRRVRIGQASGRTLGLREDRDRVEVGLDDPGGREVGGPETAQRRQVGGAAAPVHGRGPRRERVGELQRALDGITHSGAAPHHGRRVDSTLDPSSGDDGAIDREGAKRRRRRHTHR